VRTLPPVQWVPFPFPGDKQLASSADKPSSYSARLKEREEL